ncbi:unnamed protein product, partial [Amoebophrya sp. A25]
ARPDEQKASSSRVAFAAAGADEQIEACSSTRRRVGEGLAGEHRGPQGREVVPP